MNQNTPTTTRPPSETLACVNRRCELYGQTGQNNLAVRTIYGKDESRHLRCRACGSEFSERKNTALWNIKIAEAKAVAVREHLDEGCSLKGTARSVRVDPSAVRRLNQRLGEHGEAFHQERAQATEVEMLEADERHGYAGKKGQPAWEARWWPVRAMSARKMSCWPTSIVEVHLSRSITAICAATAGRMPS